MRLRSMLCSAAFLLVPSLASADAPKKEILPVTPPTASPVHANAFNAAVFDAVRTKPGNLFFSAPSMRQALGVAYLGARGTTAEEMRAVLRLAGDPASSADDAQRELADLDAAKGDATLAIANRLWADKTFPMRPDFTANAARAYGAPVDTVDFVHQSNAARLTINGWVAQKTNDKIKDLLPPGAITSATPLVITNAIYFKGSWAHAFQKNATHDQAFLADGKTSVQVPTMHQVEHFKLAQKDGVKVLELPYAKSGLAMDIVLPDAPDGLAAAEKQIAGGKLDAWTAALTSARVDVHLPKVTFSWGGSVKGTLGAMGMPTAFDANKADFSGISARAEKLWIDDVIHKAFIGIDETGSEAAASTAVVFAREMAAVELPPVTFKADHPFVFVIRDTKHDRVLFMGRVANPRS